MVEIIATIFAFIFVLLGLAGVIAPFLPGAPLAWVGLFIYAFAFSFEKISLTTLFIFLALTLASFVLDFAAPLLGAKKYKASKYSILGASLGLVFGIMTLGPVGIIAGPFLGALIGEIMAGKKFELALKPALGALAGILINSLLKIILVLTMLGFLIVSLF